MDRCRFFVLVYDMMLQVQMGAEYNFRSLAEYLNNGECGISTCVELQYQCKDNGINIQEN